MDGRPLRIVHYLNQMFGGIGGEEAAGVGPRAVEGPVGPGRALAQALGDEGAVVATLICGDNYVVEQAESALAELLALLRAAAPDLLLAGPAFNAGRYGQACGALCAAATRELGIPAVTAMAEENPGVELYHREVYVVRTGDTARNMTADLAAMLTLGRKLVRGEALGRPRDEGYFPRGRLVPEFAPQPAAVRMVDMLLAKLRGTPFESEVHLPRFQPTPAPPPVPDLRRARVALVTDGGLVPRGNPDGIESRAATRFGAYPIAGLTDLLPEDYDVSHGGYDTSAVKEDPDRLVPVDAARELEAAGTIGELYDHFLSTCGLSNPLDNSRRLGREMAEHLREAGVDAVILTST
jgi:glycine reductase complex component B subunit gamma